MTHHPAPTERQDGLAPVDPAVFLQHEVERLRTGNAELLKELTAAKLWYEQKFRPDLQRGETYVLPWNER